MPLQPIETRPFDKRKYSGIFAGGIFVPDGNILLNDLQGNLRRRAEQNIRQFAAGQKNTFHYLSGWRLTENLLALLKKKEAGLLGKKVVVIYPGMGAKTVYEFIRAAIKRSPAKYSSLRFLVDNPIFVKINRIPSGKKGEFSVVVGAVDLERFVGANIVLCVDDVISSGQTLKRLKERVMKDASPVVERSYTHMGWYDEEYHGASSAESAKWVAASWLTVEPAKKRPLQTSDHFSQIITCKLVGHSAGIIPPINSVSTFLSRGKKAQEIRRKYQRNLSETKGFGRMLVNIRRAMRRRPK